MPFRRSFPTLLLLWAFAFCTEVPQVRAQEYQGKILVEPSLVADTTAVAPGRAFTAGVLLKIAPDWHTYWQFSGDAGGAPKIEWELPPGFTAGPVQWPLPHSRMDEGDLWSIVYEGEVMLLVEITPPADLPQAEVRLTANVSWLVCEKTCIPGKGTVSLTLPVSAQAEPANTELFAVHRAQLPRAGDPPFQVKWNRTADAVTLQLAELPADFTAEFFPLPPTDVTIGHPKVSAIAADGARTITVPITEGGAPNLPWRGLLVTEKAGGQREGWHVAAEGANAQLAATRGVESGAEAPLPKQTLLAVLGLAFVGGLILNLMPCVLPVIALKIFGFIQQAGQSRERIFRLGLSFVAGVFVFFLGIAAIVVALNAAGRGMNWGFQFQNVYLLTGMIALVFVFALSMFGVFEITLGSGTATKLDKLAHKGGYGGAFMHGLFTTLLGTSCTAPFLGPALGFAVTQSAPVVFTIFLAIAAGMSLPYFLLTWQPAWMRFLPKPGVWMERVKQFMGFALLGLVVWLLWVFGQSRGVDGLVGMICFLLALGLASWILGAFRRSPVAWAVIAVLLVGTWWRFLADTVRADAGAPQTQLLNDKDGIQWQTFSPQAVAEAAERGQPVFIDFTASWCLNCKYNERVVIEQEPIRAAFREKNVLALKGDWTHGDPVITEWLKKFGRIGVPLYVIYPGGSKDPIVLPELLTQSLLLKHLAAIES